MIGYDKPQKVEYVYRPSMYQGSYLTHLTQLRSKAVCDRRVLRVNRRVTDPAGA